MVSGYYGYDNLGDDAILAVLCKDLVDLGFSSRDIVVLSGSPERTTAQYGVAALPRYDLGQIWRGLKTTRFFISGGGSLLQDVTSRRSILYYLGLVELALLRNVPVIMYAQGIGPVQSPRLRSWVGRAFKRSLAGSVRDQGSLELLLDLGLSRETIALCADPVFQHEPAAHSVTEEKRLLLNLRPYDQWEEQKQMWHKHVVLWQNQGFEVEFVPLGPGDVAMGRALQGGCADLKVHPNLTLETMGKVLSGANLFISMRLHGLIFGALHDCLPIGLNYDPKVEAISKQLMTPFWELGDLGDLGRGVGEVLHRAEEHRLDYRRALVNLHRAAMGNRAMLARALR